jgi:hypothetical protein
MKQTMITPVFVEFIPDKLDEGVIYISEPCNTIIHRCCCGCGEEVVTPLSPVDWQLKKEGKLITIRPSIGNWNYSCQSHYLVTRNKIEWAERLTQPQIQRVKDRDWKDKEHYISQINAQKIGADQRTISKKASQFWLSELWTKLKQWWER